MANGHKVKFYLNANDTKILSAVLEVINKDPNHNFDLNSFAKDCMLRQGQMYLDEIRAIQQEQFKKAEEMKNESKSETVEAGTEDSNGDVSNGESSEIQSSAQG